MNLSKTASLFFALLGTSIGVGAEEEIFTFPSCYDKDFFFWLNQRDELKGGCDHVAKKPKKRCKQSALDVSDDTFDGLVREWCPITCKLRGCSCEDKKTQFTLKNPFDGKKSRVKCDGIAELFSDTDDPEIILGEFFGICTIPKFRNSCPNTCGACDGMSRFTFGVGLDLLYISIILSGLNQLLSFPSTPVTLFGPTDEAFEKFLTAVEDDFGEGVVDCILFGDNGELLASILAYHAIEEIDNEPISAPGFYENLAGFPLEITEGQVGVDKFVIGDVNGAFLETEFIDFFNNTLYVILEVLIPPYIEDILLFCGAPLF